MPNWQTRVPHLAVERSLVSDVLRIGLCALAYFLAHQVAFFFPDSGKIIMLIWPAGGVGLAAFLLAPRRLWLPLTLAFYVSGVTADVLLAHRSVLTGVGYMTGNMAESIGCAMLILRGGRDFRRFSRVRETLALLVGAIVVNALSSCIGAGTSVLTRDAQFASSWASWYVADGLGVLVVGPLLVTWSDVRGALASVRSTRIVEWVAFVASWSLASWVIFYSSHRTHVVGVHPYVIVALLAWPALRLGQRGVTLALVLLFVIAIASPAIRIGPAPWAENPDDLPRRLRDMQLFLGVLAIVGYLLAAVTFERRRAEESLRATLESTADGILVVDKTGRIAEFNERFLQLWKIPAEIIFTRDGQRVLDYAAHQLKDPGQFLARVKELHTELETTSFDVLEFNDGRTVERYSQAQMADGSPMGRVWSFRDVTEQRRAEDALRRSEERFRLAMLGATDGLWDWNLKTDDVYYSPRWLSMLGYGVGELKSHINTWRSLVHPDDLELSLSFIRKFLDGLMGSYALEFRLRHKDGSYRNILSRGTLVNDASGTPVRLVGTHVDITELRAAEERTRQSLKEKELLLREVHHRVKNNMAVISSLLVLQRNRIDDEVASGLFDEARRRIKAMALAHEQLYGAADLSAIDVGVYAGRLVSELVSSYQREGRDIVATVDAADVSLEIDAAVPCGLILNELITNALKHAFADRARGALHVAFERKDRAYTLTVKDDGVGLPARFDPHKANTLGLQLVAGLAKQLRGTFTLNDRDGTEAVITFERP